MIDIPASRYQRPLDAASLANNFRVFADADCAGEPLYAALSYAIADAPAVLALLMQAPYPQRRPVLLFAATHDLLLAGHEHPLACFYRSCTSGSALRDDVASAGDHFVDFCRVHHDAVTALLAARSVQTNEVGRSAGLRLALSMLGSDRPIALIDVGCSAGLNLLVDDYRYLYERPDGTIHGEGPSSGVVSTPASKATIRSLAAWISAEGPNVVPGLAPPPLEPDASATRREATLWHLTTREQDRAVGRVIARSHPHGRWIEWLAG